MDSPLSPRSIERSPVPASGRSRFVAALIDATITASLLSALVLAFDKASLAECLAAQPEVATVNAICDTRYDCADRLACQQRLAAGPVAGLVAEKHTAASAPRQLAKR